MNRLQHVSRSLAALLLLAAFIAPVFAQQGGAPQDSKDTAVSKVERKNRAPVSKTPLRVKLPKPFETTLENGLTVMILEDHRAPTVSVEFDIDGAGTLYEPKETPGLANVTAQMMREGTKQRTSRQLAEATDGAGASVFAAAGFGSESATVSGSGLSDNFDEWFAMTVQVLLEPSFPADEWKRLNQRLATQLFQQRTQPAFLANERFSRAVYGDHPAAVVSATADSLKAITPEAMTAWHKERFVPQNTTLAIVGDVRPAEVLPKIKQALAAWKKTDLKIAPVAAPTQSAAKKIHLVNRAGSVQTTIALGNLSIDRRDPDYPAFVVMNRILGGGATGRLFLNLREEKGYTYGVYSSFQARRFRGPWRAGGDVRTEVTEGAMTEFIKELTRMRDEKIPATELDENKRAIVAGFALSLEQPARLLAYATERREYGLPANYWETYPDQILKVTAEDIQRVAKKYLSLDNLQVVAVGDAKKIKEALEKFGPVEVFGADGKPAQPAQ